MMHTQHRHGQAPGPPRCGDQPHEESDASYGGAGGPPRLLCVLRLGDGAGRRGPGALAQPLPQGVWVPPLP